VCVCAVWWSLVVCYGESRVGEGRVWKNTSMNPEILKFGEKHSQTHAHIHNNTNTGRDAVEVFVVVNKAALAALAAGSYVALRTLRCVCVGLCV